VTVNQGLAHLSDTLLFIAVICYAISMLGYAAEFAFSRSGGSSQGQRPGATQVTSSELAGRAAVVITVIGWALHLGSVLARAFAAHRVPWGNMYEFSSMIALIAVTVFLGMLARGQQVRYLGAFLMVPVVLYLGLAGTVLYTPAGPLVPALHSYWLKIHVAAAICATGIFMVAAVGTVLYLVRERYERRILAAATIGPGAASVSELQGVRRPVPMPGGGKPGRSGLVSKLPDAATLDRFTYRLIAFAFPIWTFAIIAGAIWAESAWGRYWGWDPKETWSFITWVVYACYLHARATAGWKGRRAAMVALLGFACLFTDFYLVNIWIVGLHSYAGVS
jgi:cytochrome c-type biogenesis protein CcsB